MSNRDLVRAWKDPAFRARLEHAPEHPSGLAELSDAELKEASGLTSNLEIITTAITCTELSWRGWKACCPY
jgi:mersacidin/lichenicidin family type 2 lantibiotic